MHTILLRYGIENVTSLNYRSSVADKMPDYEDYLYFRGSLIIIVVNGFQLFFSSYVTQLKNDHKIMKRCIIFFSGMVSKMSAHRTIGVQWLTRCLTMRTSGDNLYKTFDLFVTYAYVKWNIASLCKTKKGATTLIIKTMSITPFAYK